MVKGLLRRVYLPHGNWYEFGPAKLEGGREITRKVDLETAPSTYAPAR